MRQHIKNKIRLGPVAALACMIGLAACEQQPVLGYCEAGDTCRYDLAEPTTVRNYSGYFPVAQSRATAGVAGHASASAPPTSPKSGAPQVVAISN